MSTPGFPLLDLVVPVIDEIDHRHITNAKREEMKESVLSFIEKRKDYDSLVEEIIGFPTVLQAVDKVKLIMDTENDVVPCKAQASNSKSEKKSIHHDPNGKERRKTRQWNESEDNRLLMGVRLFGIDNWNAIAKYVGNGRLRSQCMQRWSRGLDPRISKKQWTKEEEEKLLRLVSEYKDRSWTRISAHFGNRSDVQCRYKYIQLQRANKVPIVDETDDGKEEKKTMSTEEIGKMASNILNEAIKETSPEVNDESSPDVDKKSQYPIPIVSHEVEGISFDEAATDNHEIGLDAGIDFNESNIQLCDFNSTTSSRSLFDSSAWRFF